MELLITPEQVVEAAFRAPDLMPADAVSEATILAAQQKFIRPVVGASLYEALCRGAYPALVADYIAAPLALHVKAAMLPALAVQSGVAGVVEASSKNLTRASDSKTRAALRRLRGDADALMRRLTDHLESAPDDFPEYDPDKNVLNRLSVAGGIALPQKL